MKSLLKRHRVRATFYHVVAILFVLSAVCAESGIISITAGFWIGIVLFFADYIAEMYDPNPENPGPWFESHFHRFYDGDEDEE